MIQALGFSALPPRSHVLLYGLFGFGAVLAIVKQDWLLFLFFAWLLIFTYKVGIPMLMNLRSQRAGLTDDAVPAGVAQDKQPLLGVSQKHWLIGLLLTLVVGLGVTYLLNNLDADMAVGQAPAATSSFNAAALNGDGTRLALAGYDDKIQVFQVNSEVPLLTRLKHLLSRQPAPLEVKLAYETSTPSANPRDDTLFVSFLMPNGAAVSPNENAEKIVAGTRMGLLCVWSDKGTKVYDRIRWRGAPLVAMLTVPGSERVIAADDAGFLRLWTPGTSYRSPHDREKDREPGAVHVAIHDTSIDREPGAMRSNLITALAVSGDGERVAVGFVDGAILVYELDTWRIVPGSKSILHRVPITALAFANQNNNLLAVAVMQAEPGARVETWDLLTQSAVPYRFDGTRIKMLRFTADDQHLLGADEGTQIVKWRVAGALREWLAGVQYFPVRAAPVLAIGMLNPTSDQLVAVGSFGGGAQIWEPHGMFPGFDIGQPASLFYSTLGSQGARYLLGFGLAALLASALIYAFATFAGVVSTDMFLGDLKGAEKNKAISYIREKSLGRKQLVQVATKEGIVTPKGGDSQGVATMLGGPGILTVEEGYAVVIERNGRIVGAKGPGPHFLEKGEKATMRVVLYPRTNVVKVENAKTRDEFDLPEVTLAVTHEIIRKHADTIAEEQAKAKTSGAAAPANATGAAKAEPKQKPRYEFDPKVIEEIWTPERGPEWDWIPLVEGQTRVAASEFILEYDLQPLLVSHGPIRAELRDKIERALRMRLAKKGIYVSAVRIIRIEAPPRVSKLLQDRRVHSVEHRNSILAADTDRALAGRQNEQERQALFRNRLREHLIQRLTEPLNAESGVLTDPQVAQRYIQTLERILPGVFRDDDTIQRFIDTMQKLVEAPGDKHYYFPDMRDSIGVGAPHPAHKEE